MNRSKYLVALSLVVMLWSSFSVSAASLTWSGGASTTGYCLNQWSNWTSPPVTVYGSSPQSVIDQVAAISVASNCGVSYSSNFCDPVVIPDGATSGSTICHQIGYRANVGPETPSGAVTWQCPAGQSYSTMLNGCAPPQAVDSGNNGSNCDSGGGPQAGNPIHTGTGNKFQIETDYVGATASPLRFVRTYNAGNVSPVPVANIGANWRHSYDRQLEFFKRGAVSAVEANRPDGKIYYFEYQNGAYVGKADVNVDLKAITDASGNATAWIYTSEANEVERYDAKGRLTSIQDSLGRAQTLAYDSQNRLIAVTDFTGRKLGLSYAQNNQVHALTLPDGTTITYAYDANTGDLTGAQYQDQGQRGYLYNEANYSAGAPLQHLLTGILDENTSRYATYEYNASGQAISSEHAGGVDKYTVSYGSNQSIVTDPLGTQRVTALSNVLGIVHSAGQSQPGGSGCGPASSSVAYDSNGNPAAVTDFNGNRTVYTYSAKTNLQAQRTEAQGTAVQRIINTQWHPFWRLPNLVSEPLKLTSWVYNGQPDPAANYATLTCAPAGAQVNAQVNGLPIAVLCKRSEQATTDATGASGIGAARTGAARAWTYTWDADGQMLTAKDPLGHVTTYTYRTATDTGVPARYYRGDLYTITTALNETTTFAAYDGNGRVTQMVDPNGTVTHMTYGPRGWLTGRQITAGGVTETTSYTYDNVGQLLQVTMPDDSSVAYRYDAAHRLTDMTDSLGNSVHYVLDNLGNRTSEQNKDPGGTLTRQITRIYDALNRLQKVTGGLQ